MEKIEQILRFHEEGINACYNAKAYVSCATLILIYCEAFGAYLSGKKGDSGSHEVRYLIEETFPNFKENISVFEKLLTRVGESKKWWNYLYNNFRNGLAHEGFMKVGVGLDQGPDYFNITQIRGGLVLSMNIHFLYEDYVYSKKEIISRLSSPQVKEKFVNRLEWIFNIKSSKAEFRDNA